MAGLGKKNWVKFRKVKSRKHTVYLSLLQLSVIQGVLQPGLGQAELNKN